MTVLMQRKAGMARLANLLNVKMIAQPVVEQYTLSHVGCLTHWAIALTVWDRRAG
jgi:hypothetical protein